jgi:vacuolar protein sorting-associated protein 54
VSPVNVQLGTQSARPYRFTWDPSTYRLGPGSVSEGTDARGDFTNYLLPDVFDTAPTSLPLGALPTEWSSSKHGFHGKSFYDYLRPKYSSTTAISTVLNNPHKRQAPPKAHSSLPAVLHTELPRVRRKDFEPYLRAISAEWDRFEKNSQLGREGVAHLEGLSTPRASLSSEMPTSPRKLRVVSGKSMPALETVPPIFFEPKFDLGDPRTFHTVTEQGEVEDEALDPLSLSHSTPLLEKMSQYADTVEQHLVREVSLRSTSFFAALTNLHDLQTESEHCLDRITKLRGLLKDVDDKGAKRGLEVVRKEIKLRNLNTVREGVKMVSGVVEMTGVAKGLVAAGQWGEALGVIEELERLCIAEAPPRTHAETKPKHSSIPPTRIGQLSPLPPMPEVDEHQTKPSKPVPLLSLQAFASLPNHLRTITMEITASLSLEMVNILRIDLTERMNKDAPSTAERSDINQSLKDRLRPFLHGLVRTKGVREATFSWREVVMVEMTKVTKRVRVLYHLQGDK